MLSPRRFVSLHVEVVLPDGTVLVSRDDFERYSPIWSPVHTCRRIALQWDGSGALLSLVIHSAGPQVLGFQCQLRGAEARWRLSGPVPSDAVAIVNDQRVLADGVPVTTAGVTSGWFSFDGSQPVWTIDDMRSDDERFWATAPQLTGDWPDKWRRGWVYDLETTRLMVQPPGGVYSGIWPSWMAEWPRTVVAEGSLDMARLAIADSATATEALETLWTESPAPNLPCVFRDGQPNMIADDGRICGTAPAWCLPVHQIERAFLWSGDVGWLRRILPAIEAYLSWWERERVVDGFPSYACTWESGEDDNPRLNPDGTGGGAILGQNRPPELPATFASSAWVVARLYEILGDPAKAAAWNAFAQRYADLLERTFWDDKQSRYRDLDPATGNFLESTRKAYWETDSVRSSPLGLFAAFVTLDPDRQAALIAELPSHDAPPWRWWPSWSLSVLAAAEALEQHTFASAFATRIVSRVWMEIDARGPGDEVTGRPLPGVAREYWPEPIDRYRVHDGYGWGAETATFLLHHIIGLRPDWCGGDPCFTLRPMLPVDLAGNERLYGIGPLNLRGWRFSLTLVPESEATRVLTASHDPGTVMIADGGNSPSTAAEQSEILIPHGESVHVRFRGERR